MNQYSEDARRYDLDWIKVIATFLVVLYHISMFFNSFDWHIKNNKIGQPIVELFSLSIGNWIMPLFFIISGMATYHALRNQSAPQFVKNRLLRLGIPLIFGIFFLSPIQVYIERVVRGQFSGNFLNFFPHYFDGVYLEIGGSGNFAFFGHHLWYLLALLQFSILSLPLVTIRFPQINDRPFRLVHYLLLPIPLFGVALSMNSILNLASWTLVIYFMLYLYGFYFFTRPDFWAFVRRFGPWFVAISFTATTLYLVWVMHLGFPTTISILWGGFMLVRVLIVWNVVLAVLYAGDRYLRFSNDSLLYLSEASMPIYILHQPLIIFFGFFVYDLMWTTVWKGA